MLSYNSKSILFPSIIILLLAVTASGGGLLLNNLYRDNDFVKSAWKGNDIITLLVIVPMMALILLIALKHYSIRVQLVLMGLLGYMVYNFAFYLFGAAFNIFFLVYVALLSLSILALTLGLSNLDVKNIAQRFNKKTPVKWISFYLLLISFILFAVEMSMIINYFTTGILPQTIQATAHPTGVVFALDISLVIPLSAIAAILLWKRHAWGFVLGIIMLVKAFTYGLVLCVGTALLAYSEAFGKWDPLMPFYVVVALGGFVCSWLLLKNLNRK